MADELDGALSGSTLKEAHSWGKVDKATEQMVFSEATVAFPLIAGYAYGKGNWRSLKEGEKGKGKGVLGKIKNFSPQGTKPLFLNMENIKEDFFDT